MRLNVLAFGLACAIVCGVGLFGITWWIIAFEGAAAAEQVTFIGRVYRGYSVTAVGSLVGLAWAFADGLIGGLVFAWLYNGLAGRKN